MLQRLVGGDAALRVVLEQAREQVEAELGIPLIDSTSAVVWKGLKLMGADGSCIQGWGRLFSL